MEIWLRGAEKLLARMIGAERVDKRRGRTMLRDAGMLVITGIYLNQGCISSVNCHPFAIATEAVKAAEAGRKNWNKTIYNTHS